MKLFIVRYEYEAVVLAENKEEAQRLGQRIERDIVNDGIYDGPSEVCDFTHYPMDWEPNCLVYHDGPADLELGQVLSPETAPRYRFPK